ncbi:acyltransferase family protein [Oceanobacter antarcticus]|uniref:Acyltransferase family protein n=1 Tax=Oceanobacter antarcticus TaxID=3133425 RepID=A0ABW8NEI6_9GAMM
MLYRYDINALRAIAVLSVVVFHFSPNLLPGGFAGVDIFFVISGFLMTGIIINKFEKNRFSIVEFYLARANRIIPALIFLCLTVFLIGWFFLLPLEFKKLSKHIISSLLFFSNFLYFNESGYFDAVSHEKWLLHTWSLSVEWQFYLIYPLILVFINKFFDSKIIKWILLFFTVISFGFSIVITYLEPSGAYYLIFSRAWEMFVGGLAFVFPFKKSCKTRNVIFLFGFAFIIISVLFFSENVPWPGYFAILPVMGAFFIIAAVSDYKFLKFGIFQIFGKWSYSIYLWHWPIVVVGYLLGFSGFGWVLLGLLLSSFFGFLSFRFIESLRFSDTLEIKKVLFSPLIFLYFFIISLAFFAWLSGGEYARSFVATNSIVNTALSSPYRSRCHSNENRQILGGSVCQYGGENINWAILGDSHMVEISYALSERLKKSNEGVKHYTFSACVPSFGQNPDFSSCSKWTDAAISDIINDDSITEVFLGYHYSAALFGDHLSDYPNIPDGSFASDDYRSKVLSSLSLTIETLSRSKKSVYVLLPIPELPASVSALINKSYILGADVGNVQGASLYYYNKRNEKILEFFKSGSYLSNVHFINPLDDFCYGDSCWAVYGNVSYYFDDDHPSIAGGDKIVRTMLEK